MENNFNVLRMFVRIYGASTAPTMLVGMRVHLGLITMDVLIEYYSTV